MPESRRTVLYCLVAPSAAGALEDLRAHYAQAGRHVEVVVDRRIGERRGPRDGAPEGSADRRAGADRRRLAVPRRLPPLPPGLAERAGELRWAQRLLPVGSATELLVGDDVVAAVRAGDPEAPTELYWRCYERLQSRLVRLLGDPAEADGTVVRAFGRLLDVLDDPARHRTPLEVLLYEQVDDEAAQALERRAAESPLPDGGLGVQDPVLDEPVRVVDPEPTWSVRGRRERDRLAMLPGTEIVGVEHIGSTAIPALPARPVIDLMAGAHRMPLSQSYTNALRREGFSLCGDGGTTGRLLLRRRGGDRPAVDLHVVEYAGPLWQDALLFRDLLRGRPLEARKWGEAKRQAARLSPRSARRYQDMRRLVFEDLAVLARPAV